MRWLLFACTHAHAYAHTNMCMHVHVFYDTTRTCIDVHTHIVLCYDTHVYIFVHKHIVLWYDTHVYIYVQTHIVLCYDTRVYRCSNTYFLFICVKINSGMYVRYTHTHTYRYIDIYLFPNNTVMCLTCELPYLLLCLTYAFWSAVIWHTWIQYNFCFEHQTGPSLA